MRKEEEAKGVLVRGERGASAQQRGNLASLPPRSSGQVTICSGTRSTDPPVQTIDEFEFQEITHSNFIL